MERQKRIQIVFIRIIVKVIVMISKFHVASYRADLSKIKSFFSLFSCILWGAPLSLFAMMLYSFSILSFLYIPRAKSITKRLLKVAANRFDVFFCCIVFWNNIGF